MSSSSCGWSRQEVRPRLIRLRCPAPASNWSVDGLGLRLAGSAESSSLLATASLIVQRATGVSAEPLLVELGARGMLTAARGCSVLVLGLPSEEDGLGEERQHLADEATVPVLAVR